MKAGPSRWASVLLVWPAVVGAHSPVPGLGKFYSGMLHPVLAPAALIALVAMGLLIGQRGLVNTRLPVLAFLVAVALGGVVGSQWPGLNVDTGLLVLGLLVAACALAAWQPPPAALLALAGGVGALAGLGLADMAVGAGRWLVLSGTWLGAAFLALGVAAVAELARQAWQRIGLRVFASWLAASALLVLGLQWAGPLPKSGQASTSTVAAPDPGPVKKIAKETPGCWASNEKITATKLTHNLTTACVMPANPAVSPMVVVEDEAHIFSQHSGRTAPKRDDHAE